MALFQAIKIIREQDYGGKTRSQFRELVHFMAGFHECAMDCPITADEYDYIIGGLIEYVPQVMFSMVVCTNI